MSEQPNKQILEAAIFASAEPVSFDKLVGIVRIHAPKVKILIKELQEDYKDRGVELVKVATGYRFQAKKEYASNLQKLYERSPPRYSRALLETLALIAYRQPITRGEVEAVRGVAVSSNIIKILQEREWVKVVGCRDVPGKPALFATTKAFLDYFNLRTLNDLPALEDIVDLDKAEQELTEQLTLAVAGIKPLDSIQEADADAGADEILETEITEDEIETPPNQKATSDPI